MPWEAYDLPIEYGPSPSLRWLRLIPVVGAVLGWPVKSGQTCGPLTWRIHCKTIRTNAYFPAFHSDIPLQKCESYQFGTIMRHIPHVDLFQSAFGEPQMEIDTKTKKEKAESMDWQPWSCSSKWTRPPQLTLTGSPFKRRQSQASNPIPGRTVLHGEQLLRNGKRGYIYPFKHPFRKDTGCLLAQWRNARESPTWKEEVSPGRVTQIRMQTGTQRQTENREEGKSIPT